METIKYIRLTSLKTDCSSFLLFGKTLNKSNNISSSIMFFR